jgi:FkbH-like protein
MSESSLSLITHLREVITTDKPADFLRACRMIEQTKAELKSLRIGFLSTFTINVLDPYLKVNAAVAGYHLDTYFGPFDQLEQEALRPDSDLHKVKPDIIVVAALLESISPLRDLSFSTISSEEVDKASNEIKDRLSGLREALKQHSSAHVVFLNFATPGSLQGGASIQQLECSPDDFRGLCNRHLRSIASSFPGTSAFDLAGLAFQTGLDHWLDPRMWYFARQPLSRLALAKLGSALTRHFAAILKPRKKCLVLDLDNTLWGGVLGEDGPGGILFGDDYPGNAFKDFQRYLRNLREEGVLLAIASKNNTADVEEVFALRTDFPLSLEDFAAVEIHWGDKSNSIAAIARKLSIGTDSLVFFDDNPAERAAVEMNLPEVTVIAVPTAPELYLTALREAGCFDQLSISGEDLRRADLYRVENERKTLQKQTPSRESFLASLEMKAEIADVTPLTLGRCAQLLAKTNQFNLTTRRHSEQEVIHLMDGGGIALSLHLSDRFGDLGIVGLAIAVPGATAEDWEIDSFLLSCRVLGRAAESLLLSVLLNEILAK